MKYIRTKYGIYNAIKEFKIGDMIGVPYNGLVKIIAQADTIEELCDFVYVLWADGSFDTYDISHEKLAKEYFYNMLLKGDAKEIRFGIKTDKGLIYVAKLNDKGELELL